MTFTDPRDGKVYKTVQIGEQIWMAENLAYNAEGSVCYNNNPVNEEKYGRLYNWETAKKACPPGWHLPSNEEWQALMDFGGDFSAMPGGALFLDGNFHFVGKGGFWWSASESDTYEACYWRISRNNERARNSSVEKRSSLSVRCLQNTSIFTDPRDGKVYKTVKIGGQVWMAENLAYNAEGSACYDNNSANEEKYGRLYDWKTAAKACPAGWHLPSKEEWQDLMNFAGGDEFIGRKLKAKNCWDKYGNGTDEFGFAALPGGGGGVAGKIASGSLFGYDKWLDNFDQCDVWFGCVRYSNGYFRGVGYDGNWWSGSECERNAECAWQKSMSCNDKDISSIDSHKSCLFSIRCLQDRNRT